MKIIENKEYAKDNYRHWLDMTQESIFYGKTEYEVMNMLTTSDRVGIELKMYLDYKFEEMIDRIKKIQFKNVIDLEHL